MAELIREHSTMVKDEDTIYIAGIYAEERTDGTWEGWLEFHPTDKSEPVLLTGEEASQPSRVAMDYWALGLEPTGPGPKGSGPFYFGRSTRSLRAERVAL